MSSDLKVGETENASSRYFGSNTLERWPKGLLEVKECGPKARVSD